MIFLVQFGMKKHFSQTPNCARPTGSCNFAGLFTQTLYKTTRTQLYLQTSKTVRVMVYIDDSVLKNVPEALVTGDSGSNKAKGQSAAPASCRLNSWGALLVMPLWPVFCYCCASLLLLSPHRCTQHQANHDANNYTLPKFSWIWHDHSKNLSEFCPSSLECCCVSSVSAECLI